MRVKDGPPPLHRSLSRNDFEHFRKRAASFVVRYSSTAGADMLELFLFPAAAAAVCGAALDDAAFGVSPSIFCMTLLVPLLRKCQLLVRCQRERLHLIY